VKFLKKKYALFIDIGVMFRIETKIILYAFLRKSIIEKSTCYNILAKSKIFAKTRTKKEHLPNHYKKNANKVPILQSYKGKLLPLLDKNMCRLQIFLYFRDGFH
jgi:hypothetical protein